MSIPEKETVTLEEFYQRRENTDQLLEYIDGVIYMSPSPSTKHQRISSRLHAQLFQHLDGSNCEVFPAPFDIELKNEEDKDLEKLKKIVIPDLSVICDKTGLHEAKYVGAPTVVFEILSPSNQSHDLVFKLNLYMQYGVKEYWIINPLLNTIQVYVLDDSMQYQQQAIAKDKGMVQSEMLAGFEVDIEKLYR
ncbi:Uma2 family endonuclease [Salicibibacter cibarius]|uniref:Uma2 family endonuclease n=1 Tax=Salicibibacter cibarius TaxID=2743000 RepID=A0A7T6Z6M8_9BACI|nr:Uma2 family endonuclease [Salicibibacter cibarius]QQK77637.1 Uma2 family endonuclease [Salicibibacter cibarius]